MNNKVRTRPRAYFFRDGRELTYHEANGKSVESYGMITGTIGNAMCFEKITVRTTRDLDVTEADFDGPVSVKIWSPESKAVWIGLASIETVKESAHERTATR